MTDAAAASPREEIAPLGPNESRLYVNNLPWSLTNDDLSKWIKSEIGVTAIEVSIVQNKKFERSRGYAFIKINKNDLQKCLTLNGKHINDRDIGVQEAQQRSEEERTAHREQQAAKRAEKREQRESAKAAGQPTGAPASASSPSAAQPKKERAERAPRPKTAIKQFDNATTVHITNLAFKVDQAALTAFIQQAIGVAPLDVTIPVRRGKYRTGQSLGYGFVVVPNDKADAAVALNGQTFEDRPLKVNLSRPAAENEEQATGDAPARAERPPRRNARRGRGKAAGNGESNGAAASPSGAAAASPAAAAVPESAGSAAPAKRGGARGGARRGPRAPRAGAEDGDAQ